MTAALRIGFMVRLSQLQSTNKSAKLSPFTLPMRTITSKTMRGGPRQVTHKPFPYKEKRYGYLQSLFDKTSYRFNENSKIILVEGPIAVGKTKLAKELADELEMLYVPHADMDMRYINPYGYDMRKLDPELPEMCRSFDTVNFCKTPKHPLVACFQIEMYQIRFEQYIDALAHLFSTGQGIIMDRSCYSDFVFLEAMHSVGFVSKGARSVYHEIRQNTIYELLRPHLIIYLDVPVQGVKDRIKARNLPHETNSPALTDDFLREMEIVYKQQFLKDLTKHAELLIYDWTAGGDAEVVVEDIERIDFDVFEEDPMEKKMMDWRFENEIEWCEKRIKYCSDKPEIMNFFNVPRFDVPELLRDPESGKIFREVWFNAPGMKYRPGYNADMGDTGLLLKNKTNFWDNKI